MVFHLFHLFSDIDYRFTEAVFRQKCIVLVDGCSVWVSLIFSSLSPVLIVYLSFLFFGGFAFFMSGLLQ